MIGIDVALVNTGVAAIEDGQATWRSTIKVEGEADDVGPRCAALRSALERLFKRVKAAPVLVMIEQPEFTLRERRWKGKRYETDPANIFKLWAAFGTCYAEVRRLFPKAETKAVLPQQWKGNYGKDLTAGMMRAKYRVECKDSHQWDALGLADWAWDLALAIQRRLDRER